MPEITGDKYTISVWLKLNAASVPMAGRGGSYTGRYDGMLNYVGGVLYFYANRADSGASVTVPDTGWHHYVAICDGTERRLSIDGGTPDVYDGGYAGLFDNERYIGRRDDGSYLDGSVDDVRFYNRILSADEVKALYLQKSEIHDSYVSQRDVHVDSDGNVGIGTATPSHPLTVVGNTSGISIWADGNVSASGYITRTSVFDTTKSVWDYIKDASYYLKDEEIEHKKFYGFVEYETTDFDRPIIEEYEEEVCEWNEETLEDENCVNETREKTDYPYKKMEQGISLDKEIDLLRQAVYELKEENDALKIRVDKLENPLGVTE